MQGRARVCSIFGIGVIQKPRQRTVNDKQTTKLIGIFVGVDKSLTKQFFYQAALNKLIEEGGVVMPLVAHGFLFNKHQPYGLLFFTDRKDRVVESSSPDLV